MEAPESSDIEQHEEPKQAGERVGQVLRAARLERGLDIEEVARQLRFAPRQVTALEEDEYDKLAGGPFLRGFVRNYAKLLQLDEAPLLKLLEQSVPPPTAHVWRPPSEDIPFPSGGEYLKRNVFIGGGVILAITLLGYAIYSGDEAPVAEQPGMAVESEKDTEQPTVSFPFAPQAPTAEVPESPAPAPAPSAFAPDMASQPESGIAALQETAPSTDTDREQDAAASAHKDETAGSGTEASAGEPLTLPLAPPPAPPTPPAASAVPGGEPAKVAVAPKPPHDAVAPKPSHDTAAPKPPHDTAAPKPSQVAAAPKPSHDTAAPKPPHDAAAPKPSHDTAAPKPSHDTAAPKPSQVAVAPKPSHDTAAPKPPHDTAAPKPSQVAAAPKQSPAAAGIHLTFAGESWVQVKDGNGKLLLSRVNPPGSEQVLRGKPPYSLMIGNPGQVKLVYNNRPVDLSIFAKLPDGMAHLVLE